MLFQKTDEGWKPADEATWYHGSIEWNAGCIGRLAGFCALLGGVAAVLIGVFLHLNPFALALALLAQYWRDILAAASLLFVVGVALDYSLWRGRQTPFQEALMESLNTVTAKLEAIEAVLLKHCEGTEERGDEGGQ